MINDYDKINLLNPEDVANYAIALGIRKRVPKHVENWLKSTFQRWLLTQEVYLKQCFDFKEARNPIYKLMFKAANVKVEDSVHLVVAESLPEWAVTALQKNELWHWDISETDVTHDDVFFHWIDYCLTLPARDIRMTVPQMIDAVAAWDKQLAKQKLMSSLSVGVELIEVKSFADTSYYLVKLLTQEAYANEGAVMSNCVKSYWGTAETTIYSLRQVDVAKPIATIEVVEDSIEQIKGFANSEVSLEHKALIEGASYELKLKMFALKYKCEYGEPEPADVYEADDGSYYERTRDWEYPREEAEGENMDEDGFIRVPPVRRVRRGGGIINRFLNRNGEEAEPERE